MIDWVGRTNSNGFDSVAVFKKKNWGEIGEKMFGLRKWKLAQLTLVAESIFRPLARLIFLNEFS